MCGAIVRARHQHDSGRSHETSTARGGALASGSDTWPWRIGDDLTSVGRSTKQSDLQLRAARDVNFRATHLRFIADSGDFRLEVPRAHTAQLNAYYLGTPTRTPLELGRDVQDVTPLLVAGSSGQKHDLQQWVSATHAVAAIDGRGRLRLGGVTLSAAIVAGRATLYATVAGHRQVLALGRPQR